MAQVRLLKISSDGVPLEFDSAADEITLASFTVQGGGPALGASGLDMNSFDIVDVEDLVFENPAASTINQTAGDLVIDNIMAKERSNLLTTAADILFPVISDSAGQVDSFRVPALPGAPSATPTNAGSGYLVFDSSNEDLYVWNGSAWDNLNTVAQAESIVNSYTAEVSVAARDVVFISSADNVSPADASSPADSYAIGLAVSAASAAAPVSVQSEGIMSGFSGLTAGSRYFLSAATAGAITPTIPTGTGNTIIQVGYARSASALHIQLQSLGRRA